MIDLETSKVVNIKVVGAGGGGNNSINRMIESGVKGVEFIAVNTDLQDLDASLASIKLQIGPNCTNGQGAGRDPEVGRNAALESKEEIKKVLEGADMVFITCGLGGGTGTGASPIIASIAQELGALTVGIVTKPFFWEGPMRMKHAVDGLEELRKNVDSIIVIPNDKLDDITDGEAELTDSFKEVDNVLLRGVQSISDLIVVNGLINVDFSDVKSVMSKKGDALIGIGIGVGADGVRIAAEQAVSCPLLETSIEGATDAIINVTGGPGLKYNAVKEVASIIRESANSDINVIFGAFINENLTDEIIVTVIATGFDSKSEPLYQSYDNDSNDDSGNDDESIIPTFLRKRGF
jgi:cell division protein FtsZ